MSNEIAAVVNILLHSKLKSNLGGVQYCSAVASVLLQEVLLTSGAALFVVSEIAHK